MLKLGVIGMSDGNGHPYSWSAIVNGDFNSEAMKDCGFPVIPAYLEANRDTLGIDGAKVTCVWCKEGRDVAEHCAKASLIDNVADNLEDMVGQVDAVLLARDDPENHVAMAKPFVEAGVPIFIDKPLAFSWEDLAWFTKHVEAGKFIMSSSGLRYSAGVQAARCEVAGLGEIELCVAVGKKDLRTYAIHYLEGMFSLLGYPQAASVRHIGQEGKDTIYIEFANGMLATVHVFMDMAPGGELNVYGRNGSISVNHGGSYTCFRNQLEDVIRSFQAGAPRTDFDDTHKVISVLCAARESRENGGKVVTLN